MPIPMPPYALAAPTFRFRALATLAGRSQLGGAREIALAAYMSARLADDTRVERRHSESVRAARAAAARSWLSALALPPSLRTPVTRLVEATGGEPEAVAPALRAMIGALQEHLDAPALAELEQLAAALAA